MKKTLLEITADKLVHAFIKDKIIAPLPLKYTKKLSEAQKLRKLCESKIKEPIIGFKAAGTGIPVMKKLKEKEPFYASIYQKNFLKSGQKVKINKSTLGIGSGQPSRLDSCKIAIDKMNKFQQDSFENSVAASDAFFQFVAGIETLVQAGVSAIIQPYGSIKDKEIIKFANRTNTVLVFSKTRHFRH